MNPDKNYIFVFIIAFVIFLYLGNDFKETNLKNMEFIKNQLKIDEALLQLLLRKQEIDYKTQQNVIKLETNRRVFENTDCLNCHNRPALALPIRKITLNEAMEIVRSGTEASLKGGMPLYNTKATRGASSITDADLKVRLEALYTSQFLNLLENREELLGE